MDGRSLHWGFQGKLQGCTGPLVGIPLALTRRHTLRPRLILELANKITDSQKEGRLETVNFNARKKGKKGKLKRGIIFSQEGQGGCITREQDGGERTCPRETAGAGVKELYSHDPDE